MESQEVTVDPRFLGPVRRPERDAELLDPQPDFDRAAAWAVTAYALLTADGQWSDPEQLGPFAAPHADEDVSDAYARQADAYLDNLDDDYVIVRLLCHC